MKENAVIHRFAEIGPYVSHMFTVSEKEVVFSEAKLIKYKNQCVYPFYHLISLRTEIEQRGRGLATKNLREINNFLLDEGIVGILENGISRENPSYLIYEKNGWKKSNKYPDWLMFNRPESVSYDEIDKMIEYVIAEKYDTSFDDLESDYRVILYDSTSSLSCRATGLAAK